MVSHWLQFETDEPFVPNLKKFGFVYLIINTQNGKGYVGCKQYYIGKAKKESKWQTYMGSSKYLKADIKKIGKENFRFEVIAEYKNKRSLRYYEMYYQVKWDVLTAVIEGTDEPAFYNSYVGGKFYRPVESYTPFTEEHKRKISKSKSGEKNRDYKGKAELYLDGKRMVVHCLSVWGKENGYDPSNLNQIARTIRDGFYINRGKKKGKIKAFSCKGPLGIITKVKWLGKEETNGN